MTLRVLVALHWLKRNSILYKNTEVTIDEDWATHVTRDCEETVKEFFSSEVESPENSNVETSHNTSEVSTVYDSDEEQNQDTDSEFLCFPTIYCGQTRTENSDRLIPVSYSDIANGNSGVVTGGLQIVYQTYFSR